MRVRTQLGGRSLWLGAGEGLLVALGLAGEGFARAREGLIHLETALCWLSSLNSRVSRLINLRHQHGVCNVTGHPMNKPTNVTQPFRRRDILVDI